MPRVKIDYVASFSSEDPDHPASNLLSWEVSKKRWLCRPGESSCSVVLQLSRSVQISSIQIGAYHAAVVEVLVGRSETPNDPFEVLVPSSVFLTPAESRREPQDRVRSFSGDQLSNTSQHWDRIRVVCRQPYNKQCKYGLSFIQIYEPESGPTAPKAPSPVPLAASRAIAASTQFGHSSSDEEDYRPGQLFAALRASPGTSTNTGGQIRQATSQILKNISDTSTKIVKSPIVKNTSSSNKQNVLETTANRHRDNLLYDDEELPHSKIDSVVQRHNDVKSKEKDAKDAKEKLLKEKERDKKRNERATKDDRGATGSDNNASQNKRKDDHNVSKNERNKKDETLNDQFKYKNRDDKTKRDDGLKNDRNIQKNRHNDSTVKPGRSDENDSTDRNRTTSNKVKNDHDGNRKTAKKRARDDAGELRAGPVSSSPHTLLSRAALVLSGYVHPRRARVRAAAAALGAAVLHDWGPGATHLICAFPNTPKLRQALASDPSTPIATGEWVEKCCELRRLLPWQWFATEPARRVPMPDLDTLTDDNDEKECDEECDTDDEIERVLRDQKKRRRSNTPETQADKSRDVSSDVEFVRDERIKGNLTVHDSDSDRTVDASRLDDDDVLEDLGATKNIEEDGNVTDPEPDASPGRKHEPLPNFLDGYTFYVDPDVTSAGLDVELLKRYVRAYGGVLIEEWSEADGPVDYVLCAESSAVGGKCVRADWLWRCHSERRLCDSKRYLIRAADT
ncbi:DNA repair protein XRCC1 [Amyelois transitella]|uniref:DNA repair protein XRCC1 n=1 Tax=Amyelois transitella TaxID=680683 RepID=UPI00067D0057|nr:DNA repair protein XRCC1 [Amyelois transitella]